MTSKYKRWNISATIDQISIKFKFQLRKPNQNKTFLKIFQWRTPQDIKIGISQEPLIRFPSNFELKLRKPNQNEILLEMKMTFNGRRPQNIKSGISQHTLIFFSQSFKFKKNDWKQYLY